MTTGAHLPSGLAPQGMRTIIMRQHSSPCRASSPCGDEGRQGWVRLVVTVHRVDSGGRAALSRPPLPPSQKGPASRAGDGPRSRRDTASPAIPRYSLTRGGRSPNGRPTWIPRQPSTVGGPSCDHRGPAVARHWHPGANVDPQSLRIWYQVLYILHRTLAARFFPLRDQSSRVICWDTFPPAGRRLSLGISQPGVVFDGHFPFVTNGPKPRISPFRLPSILWCEPCC
jgi:hypothetical protein